MTELRGLAVLVGICLLWAAWYTPARWAAATDALTASICAAPRPVCVGQPVPVAAAVPAADVVYGQGQMEQALEASHVPEPAAHTGAAVAMAESGGRSDAVHLCPPDCVPGQLPEQSYGAWQINRLAHPGVTVACAEELHCAAVAVAAISGRGANWSPWSTFTSGAYRRFM